MKIQVAGRQANITLRFEGLSKRGEKVYSAQESAFADYAFIAVKANARAITSRNGRRIIASYDPGRVYRHMVKQGLK